MITVDGSYGDLRRQVMGACILVGMLILICGLFIIFLGLTGALLITAILISGMIAYSFIQSVADMA